MQKATGLKLSALVIATAKQLLNKAMENLNKKIKKKEKSFTPRFLTF